MSSTPIRIILADDHKLVRESWKELLENNPAFRVVADCENGVDAVQKARELIPDILLVDINMTPGNGFSVTKQVAKELPSIRVIGLSVHNQPKYAIKMVEMGAKGYLTKTSPFEEIIRGIVEVHKGNVYICDEIKQHIPPAE